MNGNRTTGRNDILKLFFYCTILIVLVFGVYLFRIHPFYIHNDQMFQYPLFYQEWIRLLKAFFAGEGLPLYSWRLYLGSDFYASMAYYVTGDLFLPFFFLFDIDTALILETVCCFYISCFAMYGFLKSAGIRQFRNLAFISLIYTFGGWAVLYIGQYMFHRFYAFLPLLFWGAELYFQNGRRWLVALAVMILFLQNYYLMWPLSLCFLGYCFIRAMEASRKGKSFWTAVYKLTFAYGTGFLLSGFVLLPGAIYILQNPRVGTVYNTGLFWPLKVVAGFILSFSVSPFPVESNIPNLFQLDDNGYGYWYSLFITIIPFVTAFSWMRKKENNRWLIFSLILIASAFIKPLSAVFHGFSDPSMRWTFILEFILLYASAKALESAETDTRPVIAVYSVLVVISFGITVMAVGIREEYIIHYLSILLCIMLSCVIWYLYSHNKRNLAMLITIAEIAGYACLMQNTFYHDVLYDDYRLSGSQLAYLQDTDEDLIYRYYIPIEDVQPTFPNLNISLKYDFLGTRTYNSVYDTLNDPFHRLQGITDHRIDIRDPDALTMIGVKYYIVADPSELPNSDFEFVTLLNNSLEVYRNPDYRGFGYAAHIAGYTKDVSDIHTLSEGIFIDDETYELPASEEDDAFVSFQVTARSTNYLAGEITVKENQVLFLPVPCRKGWKISVDGMQGEMIPVNGGFLGIPLSEGYHHIEMFYVTPGLKTGILMSCCGFVLLVILVLRDRKSSKRN